MPPACLFVRVIGAGAIYIYIDDAVTKHTIYSVFKLVGHIFCIQSHKL